MSKHSDREVKLMFVCFNHIKEMKCEQKKLNAIRGKRCEARCVLMSCKNFVVSYKLHELFSLVNPCQLLSNQTVLGLGLIFLTMTSLLFKALGQGTDLDYTVQGQLKVIFNRDTIVANIHGQILTLPPESDFFFTAQVQKTNWIISITSPQNTNVVSEWVDISLNNKIYSLTKISEALLNSIAKTSSIPNVATALINRGPQPSSATSLTSKSTIIWLALASGPVIRDGKIKLNPVWDSAVPHASSLNIRDMQVDAVVERSQTMPFLPDNVFFINKTIDSSGTEFSTTNFVYRVVSWTNISNLLIPFEFHCLRYSTSTKNERLLVEYRGLITNIVVSEKSQELVMPEIPKPTYVNDFSVTTNSNEVIPYMANSGRFMAFTNKEAQSLVRTVVEHNDVVTPQQIDERKRIYVLGFLIASTLFPIIFILSKNKQKNKTKV